MKKVVLYMRVSTENQKEKGSIESQRVRLRDYCIFREWEIVKEYQDNGVSGSKFGKDRPGWNDLIEEVRDPRRKWDGIVSFKLDRIGRSLPHLVQIINELKKIVMDNTTCILVTQKFNLIKDLKKVVVMDNGQIADIGRHEELLERCGVYRELYEKQVDMETVELL